MPEWLKLFMEATPLPAQWAIFTFSLFFTVTKVIGSDHLKAEISLYLQGDYSKNWSHSFRSWFDSVFGDNHWSRRCFIRSTIASLVGVTALYWVFTAQLGQRPGTPLPLSEIIIIGLSVNVFADYISLRQSRWLLGFIPRLERIIPSVWGSVVSGFIWLLLDIILSASIIFSSLYLYFYAYSYLTTGPIEIPSWGQLFGIYSVYAIFIYSSFLTSVWSILFFLSVTTMRITKGLFKSNRASPDKYPFVIFSFICGTWVYFIVLGFEGLQSKGVFDDVLCQRDSEVCVAQANLTKDDKKALEYFSKACLGGSENHCLKSGQKYFNNDDAKAVQLWLKACRADYFQTCSNLGFMYSKGKGVTKNYKEALYYLNKSCNDTVSVGCKHLGVLYSLGEGVPQSDEKAAEYYKKSCDAGNGPGCFNLAGFYLEGRYLAYDADKALKLYEDSCGVNYVDSCFLVAYLFDEGVHFEADYLFAIKMYEALCNNLLHGESCHNLGTMYLEGRGVEPNDSKAISYFQISCEHGISESCAYLNQ
ncbi:tetratricopeptide repeat protein [Kiloniella majae]|uniref:tetratricopeptide repeat protein n=1 Tax=Kiloniella majae TaxID=1938558 RepID=UPI0013025DB7|nr:tetratricopeptide repeat protein [Kiloniella majae]